jgi:hypothetical protein
VTVEALSAELRDELAAAGRRRIVDPRTVPVRFSRLKRMSQSPLHYWQSCQFDDDDTLARRIGRGVHALLFGQPLVVWHARRQGNAWKDFEAEHDGEEILNEKEHAHASAVANAIKSDPIAAPLLFDGMTLEKRLTWKLDGRDCSGIPDSRGSRRVVDLKTARTTEPDRFVRASTWMSYHAQLAWYQDGIELAGLPRPEECYIVAVESVAPYAVTTLRLTERALDMGRRINRLWWEKLRGCEATNQWPGYSQSIVDFDIAEAGDFTIQIDGEDFEL